MKKTYTITFTVEEHESTNEFLNAIRGEINQERKEQEICFKLNGESSLLHLKYAKGVVARLNSVLEDIGLSFSEPKLIARKSNNYASSISRITISGKEIELSIGQLYSNKTPNIRYMTYTSEPNIVLGNRILNSEDGILEGLRHKIKTYMIENHID